jgi:hypothetical protein
MTYQLFRTKHEITRPELDPTIRMIWYKSTLTTKKFVKIFTKYGDDQGIFDGYSPQPGVTIINVVKSVTVPVVNTIVIWLARQ